MDAFQKLMHRETARPGWWEYNVIHRFGKLRYKFRKFVVNRIFGGMPVNFVFKGDEGNKNRLIYRVINYKIGDEVIVDWGNKQIK